MYTFEQCVNKGEWLVLVGQVESFVVKLNDRDRVRTGFATHYPILYCQSCSSTRTLVFISDVVGVVIRNVDRRLVSSVGRASVCCAGGRGFEP